MSLLSPQILALVGTRRVYRAPEELGRASIRYYARAVGDDNPLYTDDSAARAAGLAGVTAPPTLIFDTNQYADLPADEEGYAGHTWSLNVPGTRTVRGGNTYVWHRRIRPEDVVTATWEITDAVEKTGGDGRAMLIVTSRATYADQHGELLAENEETMIFVAIAGGSGA